MVQGEASLPWLNLGAFAGTAVSRRCAGHNPSVGQRHPPRIDEARPVLGAVTIDDDGVAEFQIAALEAAARQGARGARLINSSRMGVDLATTRAPSPGRCTVISPSGERVRIVPSGPLSVIFSTTRGLCRKNMVKLKAAKAKAAGMQASAAPRGDT